MWELDYKESWAPKNWCFQTVMLEKILEILLDCKEFKPVHLKGNQLWIFLGRTDAEPDAPIIWLPDAKSWIIEKDPDAGKDLRQEKETIEDEMVGWHHQLNGHEFEQTLGDGKAQGSLVCCSLWDCKESDRTEWLNNNLSENIRRAGSLSSSTYLPSIQIHAWKLRRCSVNICEKEEEKKMKDSWERGRRKKEGVISLRPIFTVLLKGKNCFFYWKHIWQMMCEFFHTKLFSSSWWTQPGCPPI